MHLVNEYLYKLMNNFQLNIHTPQCTRTWSPMNSVVGIPDNKIYYLPAHVMTTKINVVLLLDVQLNKVAYW